MPPTHPAGLTPRETPTSTSRDGDVVDPGRKDGRDRGSHIGRGVAWLAAWSLRLVLIGLAAYGLVGALGELWVVVLPVVLALLLTSVLWTPTAWLLRHRVPSALAALLVIVGALAALTTVLAGVTSQVADQTGDIAKAASGGLERVQEYVTGPPLNLDDEQVDEAVAQATDWLRDSASAIADGVLSGFGALSSYLVTFLLCLILTFYFLKDGQRFLPWLSRLVGGRAGRHLDVVLGRSFTALGSFILSQAAVGLADAVLIGIGLTVLGVPLALPLAVLTFFGGFIPIIGAIVVGALAVLVSLVSSGLTTALIVVGLVIVVQQVEGNILQPVLQGRSLGLHSAVVLLAVTAGSALYGVAGAFFAVPLTAIVAVVVRYLSEVTAEGSEVQDDEGAAPASPE